MVRQNVRYKTLQRLSGDTSAVLTELLERVYDTAGGRAAITVADLERLISEMRRGQP